MPTTCSWFSLHSHRHMLEEKLKGPLFPRCLPEVVSEVLKQLDGLWTQDPLCLHSH